MGKYIIFLVIGFIGGLIIGIGIIPRNVKKELDRRQNLSDKHLELFLLMYIWVKLKQEKKNIAEYFRRNGYQKIAVYGISYVGECLLKELQNSGINVKYTIDKRKNNKFSDVRAITVVEEFEPVDVIVVTAITFFDTIHKTLLEKTNIPVVSMLDVLLETSFDT